MTHIGMSPLEAITAGTSNAAALLGLDEDLGTLEVGKIADLVVCQGDPLNDIGLYSDSRNVLMVMQGGRIAKDLLPSTSA